MFDLTLPSLLAAQMNLGGLPIMSWIIIIMVVAGAVAILYVILRQLGISIPPFMVTIFWILVAVFVGIIAIKILASML